MSLRCVSAAIRSILEEMSQKTASILLKTFIQSVLAIALFIGVIALSLTYENKASTRRQASQNADILKDSHRNYLSKGILPEVGAGRRDAFIRDLALGQEIGVSNPDGEEGVAYARSTPRVDFLSGIDNGEDPSLGAMAAQEPASGDVEGEDGKVSLTEKVQDKEKPLEPVVPIPDTEKEKAEAVARAALTLPVPEEETVDQESLPESSGVEKLVVVEGKGGEEEKIVLAAKTEDVPKKYHYKQPAGGGKIVIIIDDMGVSSNSRRVEEISYPLTLSYLPFAGNLQSHADRARANGHEVMLHMPMEAVKESNDGGARVLKVGQGTEEFDSILAWGLNSFKGYVGVNNHMGSRLTQDKAAMRKVMAALKARGLYFIDSKTIGSSVAASMAAEAGLDYAERDIFLDHEITAEFIENALRKVEDTAYRKGYAIAIGHPHSETIAALQRWLPTLEEKGLTIVPASAVLRHAAPDDMVTKVAENRVREVSEPVVQSQVKPETPETAEKEKQSSPDAGFAINLPSPALYAPQETTSSTQQ